MATKSRFLCSLAISRRLRKIFSANGQPQWRRKESTVPRPASRWSFGDCGAFASMCGMESAVGVEDCGANQELSSCWNVMLSFLLDESFRQDREKDIWLGGLAMGWAWICGSGPSGTGRREVVNRLQNDVAVNFKSASPLPRGTRATFAFQMRCLRSGFEFATVVENMAVGCGVSSCWPGWCGEKWEGCIRGHRSR